MKAYIDKDEWYPVYSIDGTESYNHGIIDIPDDKYKEWDFVFKEFQRIQDEIKQLLKDA